MGNSPAKRKLGDRDLKERYLRTMQEGQYKVLVEDSSKTKLIKIQRFMLSANFDKASNTPTVEKNAANHIPNENMISKITQHFSAVEGNSTAQIQQSILRERKASLAAVAIKMIDKVTLPQQLQKVSQTQ